MRFLMCRPQFYGIEYEINPWMNKSKAANSTRAEQQWNFLYNTLRQNGASIDLVNPAPGVPDMVFTANAGLYYHQKIILPHFKFKERQAELPYFKTWFEKAGFEIANTITPETAYFEGAGDALLAGEKLFAGFGFRSEQRFYEADFFDQGNFVYCELVNPYFYHIDTCFCPLDATHAIWYPAAFSKDSQRRMSDEINLIEVTEPEAKHFACNSVVLDNKIVTPAHCEQLTKTLEQRGFEVFACEMNEYLKAGGACKCLTLRLD